MFLHPLPSCQHASMLTTPTCHSHRCTRTSAHHWRRPSAFLPRPPTKPQRHNHICLMRLRTDRHHKYRGSAVNNGEVLARHSPGAQPSRSSSASDVTMTKPSLTTSCEGKRHSWRPMTSMPASSAGLAGILRPFASLSSAGLRTFNVAILVSLSCSKMFFHSSHLGGIAAPAQTYPTGNPRKLAPISPDPVLELGTLQPFTAASANESAISFQGSRDFPHGSFQALQQHVHSHNASDV